MEAVEGLIWGMLAPLLVLALALLLRSRKGNEFILKRFYGITPRQERLENGETPMAFSSEPFKAVKNYAKKTGSNIYEWLVKGEHHVYLVGESAEACSKWYAGAYKPMQIREVKA